RRLRMAPLQASADAHVRAETGLQLDSFVGVRMVLPDRLRNYHRGFGELSSSGYRQLPDGSGGPRPRRRYRCGPADPAGGYRADGCDRVAAADDMGGEISLRIFRVVGTCPFAGDARRSGRNRPQCAARAEYDPDAAMARGRAPARRDFARAGC